MTTRSALATLVLVVVILAGGGYYYWTTTVQYSLHQIQVAVEAHDVAKFQKYVDIDSVTGRAIDDLLEHTMAQQSDDMNAAEQFGAGLAAGLISMMKPKLMDRVRGEIIQEIEGSSGSTATDSGSDQTNKAAEAPVNKLEQLFSSQDSRFERSYLKHQGKVAFLGIERHDQSLQGTIPLEFKLRDMNGHWQVVAISNLPQAMDRIDSLKKQRLAAINEPIRKKLQSAITIGELGKRTIEKDYEDLTYITANVQNNTTRMISSISMNIRIYNQQDELLDEFLASMETLQPNAAEDGIWELDPNMFDKKEMELYETPESNIVIEATTKSITYNNGETISLKDSL